MIPVYEPEVTEADVSNVIAALRRGEISGTFGDNISAFEQEFAKFCGSKHGIAVNSGSSALELAAAAAGIVPGDEVLVSASTNIATAMAAVHIGALPVPVDSEPVTWNLDLDLIDALVTERTRAIIPVHLYGHPVDMQRLCEVARKHQLIVIEDCAESHGAKCRGRMTGSFGHMGCFSFYANKVITTGEGGMIVTDDDSLAHRLRAMRDSTYAKPRFRHSLPCHNFRLTGVQAALGRSQLARIVDIVAGKRRVAATYSTHLAGVPGLQLPTELEWALNVYWMYAIVVTEEFGRTGEELADDLAKAGIQTRGFFCPMNQQPVLHDLPGFRRTACPVADRLWKSGLYLPSSPRLDEQAIMRIARIIAACRRH